MINILSKDTIDKIAAGEVAERPESVVKELLDNAVDSGADSISVEIRGGGLELIRVTDNGCGIESSEIRKAFLRHATSKLKSSEDLEHILSMGFRGEALASIASVAAVEMITKSREALSGTDYRIEFGNEKDIREVGVPDGTTVIVRDFLENVPVRRQFLKSAKTETAYIVNTAEKIALAHPDISITLNTDGRCVFSTIGNGRLRDVIYTIFGSGITSALREVRLDSGGILVEGYTANPETSRSRRDQEIFFVNGRWISSEVLQRALENACAPYLMQHRYPFAVLNIRLAPGKVDVNVHPRKSEVRFASDQDVYDAVFSAVSEAMSRSDLIVDAGKDVLSKLKPESDRDQKGSHSSQLPPEPFETNRRGDEAQLHLFEKPADYVGGSVNSDPTGSGSTNSSSTGNGPTSCSSTGSGPTSSSATGSISIIRDTTHSDSIISSSMNPEEDGVSEADVIADNASDNVHDSRFLSASSLPYFKMVGQIFETYWIIEYNDEMYIIDQHAAHEKVNYERFMSLINNHEAESQMIFPPVILTLSARESALLEDSLSCFNDAGYDIEHAGDRDFIVRAVPSNLPELNERELLLSFIDSLFEDGRAMTPAVLKDKIASMSCKAAVKGHTSLSEAEMKHLVEELLTLQNPYNCPHGRPTIIRFSKKDIEKLFKRIV